MVSSLNLQLIKTACVENTCVKETDLSLHHSDGVEMQEYKDRSNMIDLFLLDPPYYGAEDYNSNDARDLCYIKDIKSFNDRFRVSMLNLKRLIKPSDWTTKVFRPIIIKCGSVRRGDKGLINMATEIENIGRDIGLILHDTIVNELRSATQHYNVGRCIKNRYTIKTHETSLVFVKYGLAS